MENSIPPLLSGSGAIYEPFPRFLTGSRYSFTDQDRKDHTLEMQSASVTASGYLWQRNLARREPVTESNLQSLHRTPNIDEDARVQKKQELVELLKGWCEDDAQEQYDTLEYLKQALDEDRLSDRKLFQ